jgi:hypothetical protein
MFPNMFTPPNKSIVLLGILKRESMFTFPFLLGSITTILNVHIYPSLFSLARDSMIELCVDIGVLNFFQGRKPSDAYQTRNSSFCCRKNQKYPFRTRVELIYIFSTSISIPLQILFYVSDFVQIKYLRNSHVERIQAGLLLLITCIYCSIMSRLFQV